MYIPFGAGFASHEMCVEPYLPYRSRQESTHDPSGISQATRSAEANVRLFLNIKSSLATDKEVITIDPGQTLYVTIPYTKLGLAKYAYVTGQRTWEESKV